MSSSKIISWNLKLTNRFKCTVFNKKLIGMYWNYCYVFECFFKIQGRLENPYIYRESQKIKIDYIN